MKHSSWYHAILAILILGLSGCGRIINWGKETFYQAEKIVHDSKTIVQPYVRSVAIYDQLSTQALFDALWLSDEVRVAYADLYTFRRGQSQEQKNALLERQLEENDYFISLYVLSLHEVLLDDPESPWALFLQISENAVTPIEVKALELPYEYRLFFDSHLTPFKTAYLVRFTAKNMHGQPLITSHTGTIALYFRSAEKEHALCWHINQEGKLVCPQSKIRDSRRNQKKTVKRIA